MPQFIPMESLLCGKFGPIGALAAILELIEYVEPSFFLAGRELTQHRTKKVIVYTVSNLYVKHNIREDLCLLLCIDPWIRIPAKVV